jgi:nitroimidazol reductase NimA-like FMN-containing flavoprotein (pyridoxamine 5'-phosphate oxidase superfamily)
MMRKKMADNKSSSDLKKIEVLIKKSMVCRLGINHGKIPYVVPLSFGYRDKTLYFHSGPKGKKLNLLRTDPNVCFEIDRITEIMEADNPCSWDIKYQSIIGSGKAEFIEDTGDKIKALQVIISQYTDRQMNIPEARAKATMVFQVAIGNMSYKQNPA